MAEGVRQRFSRRAKLQGVDYAVLASGQQIPEYSSDDDDSEDDETYGGSSKKHKRRRRAANSSTHDARDGARSLTSSAAKRKRKASTPTDCFICQRDSKSPFMQCEICARWYHYRCWKPFESASVLGNTSCHEVRRSHTQSSCHTSMASFAHVLPLSLSLPC